MGWEVEERFKRKETYVYLWLVHADVWQKPTQHCKAIILQLNRTKLKQTKNTARESRRRLRRELLK